MAGDCRLVGDSYADEEDAKEDDTKFAEPLGTAAVDNNTLAGASQQFPDAVEREWYGQLSFQKNTNKSEQQSTARQSPMKQK